MSSDNHARALGDHGHPSRPNLTDALAVGVSAPRYLYPRPFRDAEGRWHEVPDDTDERFQPHLREIAELVAGTAPPEFRDQAAASVPQRYSYGPLGRGGKYEAVHYVITVAPAVTAAADAIVTWVTIGGWALRIKQGWHGFVERRRAENQYPADDDHPWFAPPFLRALCLAHALEAYPTQDLREVATHGRHFESGSPDLPNGREVYNVSVRFGDRTYVYVVNGRGKPLDHFIVGAEGAMPLDLPDFGDYVADPLGGVGEYMELPRLRLSAE